MSISEIDTKLLILGQGLRNKKKYDFSFKYDKYDFLKLRFTKRKLEQIILNNNIYKKL